MTSSGMYDYAGEWIYRVGIPAKSGVGGGILAALPARLGLGSYSPKLDKHGNSVRGIKVCEALSAHYDLHMLNRSDDARNSIIADYDIGKNPSRRVPPRRMNRRSSPRTTRTSASSSWWARCRFPMSITSRASSRPSRARNSSFSTCAASPSMTRAGARLLAEEFRELAAYHVTVILSGIKRPSQEWKTDRRMDRQAFSNIRELSICSMPRSNGRKTRWSIATAARSTSSRRPNCPNSRCWRGLTDEELTDLASLARDQDLSGRREDRRRRRSRDLAVLPPERRGACHPARRHPAGDADGRHGVRRDGAAGAQPLRRRARRHGRDRL